MTLTRKSGVAPLLQVVLGWLLVSTGMAADNAQELLGQSWYQAGFVTRFPPERPGLPPASGDVTLYANKADTEGKRLEAVFKPIPKELAAALAAKTTSNPFRGQFADLYSADNLSKRQQCTVLGVPFALDDKKASKEWVVSFSAEQCLHYDDAEKLRSGDTEPHQWIVQKTANGQYRVLAEGDGSVYVTNHQKEQGYKEISTRLLVKRAFPENELQCGGAELTWRYRNNAYYLADTEYMAQDCQPLYFPGLTGEAWQNAYDEYERRVKVLVDEWVGNLKKAE